MTVQEKLITWISEAEAEWERLQKYGVRFVTRQQFVAARLIKKQVTVFPIEQQQTVYTWCRLPDEEDLLLCELHVTEVGRRGFWCSSCESPPYEGLSNFFDWTELGLTVFKTKDDAIAHREDVALLI